MLIEGILISKDGGVATVRPDATLTEAARDLARHGVGALVVTAAAGGPIVGIVSERDLARALATHGAAMAELPVSAVMTADVLTCKPSDTVDHVMALMTSRRIRHLPVVDTGLDAVAGRDAQARREVDARGEMVGIVSIGDVVKHRLSELSTETDALHEYIATGR